jgi:hypothetical protein
MSSARMSAAVKPRTPLRLPVSKRKAEDESDSKDDLEEKESCSICVEPYTKNGSRKKIVCPYCSYSACRGCTERVLTDESLTKDPACMNCKKAWMITFIHSTFTKSFYLGDLKQHRAEVLRQRETSLLPGTQIVMEMRDRFKDEDNKLKEEKLQLEAEQMRIYDRLREIKTRRNEIKHAQTSSTGEIKMEEAERKVFVRACPGEDCRGFLSQRWKCGVCNIWVCSTCHAIKGDREDAEHKCNQDDVKSAEIIMKDTKPCPACGVRIFKTFGCNQFWCTHCHTAFDWASGKKLEPTRIHNPYYFDYLAKNKGDVAHPNNAVGNLAMGCDNLDPGLISSAGGRNCKDIARELAEIMRFRNETLESLERYPRPDNIDRNIDVRIRFMKNEIDEKRFGSLLQQRDKKNNKLYAEGDILRMFTDVALEHLLHAQTNRKDPNEVIVAHTRLQELRKYTNNCLIELSRQYNNVCIAIDYEAWFCSNTDVIRGKVKKSKKKNESEDGEENMSDVE